MCGDDGGDKVSVTKECLRRRVYLTDVRTDTESEDESPFESVSGRKYVECDVTSEKYIH